jgi:hypothetical protein
VRATRHDLPIRTDIAVESVYENTFIKIPWNADSVRKMSLFFSLTTRSRKDISHPVESSDRLPYYSISWTSMPL